MVFVPAEGPIIVNASDIIVGGFISLIGYGGGPGFVDKLKTQPIWNDADELEKLPPALKKEEGRGKSAIIVQKITAKLQTRINDLRGSSLPQPPTGPGGVPASGPGTLGTGNNPFGAPDNPFGIRPDLEPVFGMTVPAAVGDIFKGTKFGGVIRGAGNILKGIPKIGAGPLVIGGAATIEAVRAAIEAQKALESKRYAKKTAREEKKDRLKGRKIRRGKLKANKKSAAEEKRRLKALERQQKMLDAAEKRMHARAARVRKFTNRVIKEADDLLKVKPKRLPKTPPFKPFSMPQSPKAKFINAAAALAGALIRDRLTRPGSRSSTVTVRPPELGRIDLGNSFTAGRDFTSLRVEQPLLAGERTKVTTRTKLKNCRSDTPKRKKGVCRSGFFRETPNRTTYKTWSERKCL